MALLEVKHLNKQFKVPQGLLYAVNNVSFTLDANSTLGVVGESGCGKSTLGRVIIHLLEKTSGEIWFDGEDVSDIRRDKLTELRRKMQMIFQDPYSSLNPKMPVADIIGEPLKIFCPKLTRAEYEKKVKIAMDTVGLFCMANKILKGRPALGPVVEGYAFVCPTSIQGWSSIDTSTGVVLEKGHIHEGDSFAGKILVVPCSRGSLGWAGYFHNCFLNGVGPIGFVFTKMDSKCGDL